MQDKSFLVHVTKDGHVYVLLSDLAQAVGWSPEAIAQTFRRLNKETLSQELKYRDRRKRFAHILDQEIVESLESMSVDPKDIKVSVWFASLVATAVQRGVTQLATLGLAEFTIKYAYTVQPIQATSIYDSNTGVESRYFVVALDRNDDPVDLTVRY